MRPVALLYIPLFLLFLFPYNATAQLIVNVRPAKPAHITRTQPPGPAYVWVEEDWQVQHEGYEWAGGRWEPLPNRWSSWVPGHWETRESGHVWVPGYWRNNTYGGHYADRHRRNTERKAQIVVDSKRTNDQK